MSKYGQSALSSSMLTGVPRQAAQPEEPGTVVRLVCEDELREYLAAGKSFYKVATLLAWFYLAGGVITALVLLLHK